MKHFAQTLLLVDDPLRIEEYKRAHQRIWPEVAQALRAAGIREMHIFLHGCQLFMSFQAPDDFDPARDYQRYALDPRCQAWERWMQSFQRPLPDSPPGSWWAPMECVFDLADQP